MQPARALAVGPALSVGRRCAVCSAKATTMRNFTPRDLMAVNAARVADGRTIFEMPEGSCFKCNGCYNALLAVLPLLDAQPEINQHSPAKRAKQSRGVNNEGVGGYLTNRRGSTGSRKSLRHFLRQAELRDDFDRSSELVESVNRVMESLLEVKSVTRVTLVTSVRGAKDKYRAGRVYVDDKPEDRAWALTSEKSRDDPPLTNNNNNTRQLRRQRRHP